MAGGIDDITDDGFEQNVLKSEVPVLVDFWAVWCAPCKAIVPALEQIAAANAGKLKVVKLNVEENLNVPARYGVRGVPTLLLFKDGDVKETFVGSISKDKILNAVAKYVGP
jgi:thioredoxin 1